MNTLLLKEKFKALQTNPDNKTISTLLEISLEDSLEGEFAFEILESLFKELDITVIDRLLTMNLNNRLTKLLCKLIYSSERNSYIRKMVHANFQAIVEQVLDEHCDIPFLEYCVSNYRILDSKTLLKLWSETDFDLSDYIGILDVVDIEIFSEFQIGKSLIKSLKERFASLNSEIVAICSNMLFHRIDFSHLLCLIEVTVDFYRMTALVLSTDYIKISQALIKMCLEQENVQMDQETWRWLYRSLHVFQVKVLSPENCSMLLKHISEYSTISEFSLGKESFLKFACLHLEEANATLHNALRIHAGVSTASTDICFLPLVCQQIEVNFSYFPEIVKFCTDSFYTAKVLQIIDSIGVPIETRLCLYFMIWKQNDRQFFLLRNLWEECLDSQNASSQNVASQILLEICILKQHPKDLLKMCQIFIDRTLSSASQISWNRIFSILNTLLVDRIITVEVIREFYVPLFSQMEMDSNFALFYSLHDIKYPEDKFELHNDETKQAHLLFWEIFEKGDPRVIENVVNFDYDILISHKTPISILHSALQTKDVECISKVVDYLLLNETQRLMRKTISPKKSSKLATATFYTESFLKGNKHMLILCLNAGAIHFKSHEAKIFSFYKNLIRRPYADYYEARMLFDSWSNFMQTFISQTNIENDPCYALSFAKKIESKIETCFVPIEKFNLIYIYSVVCLDEFRRSHDSEKFENAFDRLNGIEIDNDQICFAICDCLLQFALFEPFFIERTVTKLKELKEADEFTFGMLSVRYGLGKLTHSIFEPKSFFDYFELLCSPFIEFKDDHTLGSFMYRCCKLDEISDSQAKETEFNLLAERYSELKPEDSRFHLIPDVASVSFAVACGFMKMMGNHVPISENQRFNDQMCFGNLLGFTPQLNSFSAEKQPSKEFSESVDLLQSASQSVAVEQTNFDFLGEGSILKFIFDNLFSVPENIQLVFLNSITKIERMPVVDWSQLSRIPPDTLLGSSVSRFCLKHAKIETAQGPIYSNSLLALLPKYLQFDQLAEYCRLVSETIAFDFIKKQLFSSQSIDFFRNLCSVSFLPIESELLKLEKQVEGEVLYYVRSCLLEYDLNRWKSCLGLAIVAFKTNKIRVSQFVKYALIDNYYIDDVKGLFHFDEETVNSLLNVQVLKDVKILQEIFQIDSCTLQFRLAKLELKDNK